MSARQRALYWGIVMTIVMLGLMWGFLWAVSEILFWQDGQ